MRRTIACEDRDFVAWRGGAEHALIWGVLVDTDDVRAAVDSARAHWADVLLPRYERQPHVTVGYGGPVPAPGAEPEDPPYTPDRIDEARATIRGLGLTPFELRVGGWGTFQMTPYLAVHAPQLEALADALGENRRRRYVPHVTFGHYGVAVPLDEVAARAAAWCPPRLEPITVTGMTLLRYDAADIAGPLTAIETVDFT